MGEKTYKSLTGAGTASLVGGIIMIAAGITAGVLAIVSGAKILSNRSNITF